MQVEVHDSQMQKLKDPTGATRYVFMIPALEVPDNLPVDPNPRAPIVDRPVWREIKRHLMNDEGTPNVFHLKNKGITAIAEKVEARDGSYFLTFLPGQGVVDGGHTYKLLKEARADIEEVKRSAGIPGPKPVEQFVKMEVLTGVPLKLVPEIARGLNTSIQVQEMSLMELQHSFDWIKEALKDEVFFDKIAWREGDAAPEDVRKIITIMDLFNLTDFPNDGPDYPIRAYAAKAQVLNSYKNHQENYEALKNILGDLLVLHDLIEFTAPMYSSQLDGHFTFVETKKRGVYRSLFSRQESPHRLYGGALMPILGAFRWMVVKNADQSLAWKEGGFGRVLKIWEKTAVELLRSTQLTAKEIGSNPYIVGRSRNHWGSLHKTVAQAELTAPEQWKEAENQPKMEDFIEQQEAYDRMRAQQAAQTPPKKRGRPRAGASRVGTAAA